MSSALPTISFQEYLAGEANAERKHEWVAGWAFLIAGGTEQHDPMSGRTPLDVGLEGVTHGWRHAPGSAAAGRTGRGAPGTGSRSGAGQ